ncbi:MAG: MBL fold metallo-hydrolase [Acidobacteriota bacterium]|nr:MBL fold metallo-hydrolase [Acidobacteriota bacterium]MDW3229145.1 MBL fold metallo-hydrolase [Acidobacteriota bacterium]MDY0231119.1 MBL fold metallo-hydrolase [Candidatus Saccharicenans sp.]
MEKLLVLFLALLLGLSPFLAFGQKYEEDLIATASGNLRITFLGHATLMFTFQDKVIHVDPWSEQADYASLPKADLILITHDHFDHLDPEAIRTIKKDSTVIIGPANCQSKVSGLKVMKNGQKENILGLEIEAIPAYNLTKSFHPKGVGNGYIITFADKRVYIAGDTENVPEMKNLKNIEVAFLPMNQPYTMTPEQVAEAARWIKPAILYPYHYGETEVSRLIALLKDNPEIEVRIRKLN